MPSLCRWLHHISFTLLSVHTWISFLLNFRATWSRRLLTLFINLIIRLTFARHLNALDHLKCSLRNCIVCLSHFIRLKWCRLSIAIFATSSVITLQLCSRSSIFWLLAASRSSLGELSGYRGGYFMLIFAQVCRTCRWILLRWGLLLYGHMLCWRAPRRQQCVIVDLLVFTRRYSRINQLAHFVLGHYGCILLLLSAISKLVLQGVAAEWRHVVYFLSPMSGSSGMSKVQLGSVMTLS